MVIHCIKVEVFLLIIMFGKNLTFAFCICKYLKVEHGYSTVTLHQAAIKDYFLYQFIFGFTKRNKILAMVS